MVMILLPNQLGKGIIVKTFWFILLFTHKKCIVYRIIGHIYNQEVNLSFHTSFVPISFIVLVLHGLWLKWSVLPALPVHLASKHYDDLIMTTLASQITSLAVVYSIVYSGVDKKKTSMLRVTGLCAGNSPVNSPHKGPVTRKMFSFDDVIMIQNPNLVKWLRLVGYHTTLMAKLREICIFPQVGEGDLMCLFCIPSSTSLKYTCILLLLESVFYLKPI